jgi:hypothetical protein
VEEASEPTTTGTRPRGWVQALGIAERARDETRRISDTPD